MIKHNSPLAVVYHEHVNAVFTKLVNASVSALEVDALALSMDDNTVFHIYSERPRTHFIGAPLRAKMNIFASSTAFGEFCEKVNNTRNAGYDVTVAVDASISTLTIRVLVNNGHETVDARVMFVPLRSDLYSRSSGLLESDVLGRKRVAIIGLGSGGSSIAVALTQAGVGNIVLIDRDRIEISNISRHVCGTSDVGRFKTLAVRDILFGKNPYVNVFTYNMDIMAEYSDLKDAIEGCDLIIGATDSDESKFQINQLSVVTGIVAIFGRALARAAGGDVLRVRPRVGPCLACVYTERFIAARGREFSNVSEVKRAMPAYTSDPEAIVQVGLASDIFPISNMIVKLALIELSGEKSSGMSGLEEDLTANFYLWANRREANYKSWSPMGYAFDKPSILRWYGGDIPKRGECKICGLSSEISSSETDFFAS